ncbi:TatD family deoxyribonuclease [Streptococcus pneumoniae]|nr:TatD family deoxyribonuclease [Streptococcus pneumoniae]
MAKGEGKVVAQNKKARHDYTIVDTLEAGMVLTGTEIKSEGVGPRGGIMHSFSGTLEWAEKFVDLGMTISFSGVVTFKKATDLQEAAKELPLDKMLVETDAPYLAPVPKRGRENKTAYTRYVVDFIADLRGMTTEELAAATTANAERIFGLDSK